MRPQKRKRHFGVNPAADLEAAVAWGPTDEVRSQLSDENISTTIDFKWNRVANQLQNNLLDSTNQNNYMLASNYSDSHHNSCYRTATHVYVYTTTVRDVIMFLSGRGPGLGKSWTIEIRISPIKPGTDQEISTYCARPVKQRPGSDRLIYRRRMEDH